MAEVFRFDESRCAGEDLRYIRRPCPFTAPACSNDVLLHSSHLCSALLQHAHTALFCIPASFALLCSKFLGDALLHSSQLNPSLLRRGHKSLFCTSAYFCSLLYSDVAIRPSSAQPDTTAAFIIPTWPYVALLHIGILLQPLLLQHGHKPLLCKSHNSILHFF